MLMTIVGMLGRSRFRHRHASVVIDRLRWLRGLFRCRLAVVVGRCAGGV